VNPGSSVKNRRAFLRLSGTWMAAAGLPAILAAQEQDRALVCIYLMIASSGAALAVGDRITPAMAEMSELYSEGVAAIVNVAAPAGYGPSPELRYSALRFLPGGSFTPRKASPENASVATLPSGLTVASQSAADAITLAAAVSTASLQTEFPETGTGRQLREAAALLRMRNSFGLRRPVLTAVISGFHADAAVRNDEILTDLSHALGAFYRSTMELNISKQVTTYTDMDFGASPAGDRPQLVLGGSVRGGRVYGEHLRSSPYEEYMATLVRWPGAASSAGLREPIGFLE
jgi:uncharacterized protein (DUF1501 family)